MPSYRGSDRGIQRQREISDALEPAVKPRDDSSVVTGARFSRLQALLQTYLRVENLRLLGKIPEDQALRNSVDKYQPVSSLEPNAIASLALQAVCEQLLPRIQKSHKKQRLQFGPKQMR